MFQAANRKNSFAENLGEVISNLCASEPAQVTTTTAMAPKQESATGKTAKLILFPSTNTWINANSAPGKKQAGSKPGSKSAKANAAAKAALKGV